MKLIKKTKINNEYEIKFLSLPLVQYGSFESKEKKEKYFEIFPKSYEAKMLDEILKTTTKAHDWIFLLRAGLGEAYLLNFMLDEILKNKKIKTPCFVCHRKSYKYLFELYFPNIPFYYIDIDIKRLFPMLTKRFIKYKGHNFNINPTTLKEVQKLFNDYEKNIETRHYTDVIKEFNKINNFSFKKPCFKKETETSLIKKTKNLNKNNFIFIINDANFVTKLPEKFWKELEESLKEKGYDVFINSQKLTISEAIMLADKAKAIIGLRCGFSELISTLNTKKYIIYTTCKHNNLPKLEQILTLKKYPFVNKETIFEYNILKDNIEIIKNKILGEL